MMATIKRNGGDQSHLDAARHDGRVMVWLPILSAEIIPITVPMKPNIRAKAMNS